MSSDRPSQVGRAGGEAGGGRAWSAAWTGVAGCALVQRGMSTRSPVGVPAVAMMARTQVSSMLEGGS